MGVLVNTRNIRVTNKLLSLFEFVERYDNLYNVGFHITYVIVMGAKV